MSEAPAQRPCVVTVSMVSDRATAPDFWRKDNLELRTLSKIGEHDFAEQAWKLRIGDLGEEARARVGAALRAADEYGVRLRLSLEPAPADWVGPTLVQPLRSDQGRPRGEVDPATVSTMLIVDVCYVPGGPIHHWWVAGDPPMGTHPDPEAAFAAIRSWRDDSSHPFAHVPGESSWGDEDGGPQWAQVRGMLNGKWVQGRFTRAGSVEVAAWERVGALIDPTLGRDVL